MDQLGGQVLTQLRSVYKKINRLPEIAETVHHVAALIESRDRYIPSPIDRYLLSTSRLKSGGLFHPSYEEWRVTRLDKLFTIYGVDYFRGKSVLELGGGHGEIGAVLAELGASVLCLEGRARNVAYAQLRQRSIPGFRCVQADLEDDFSHFGQFDLIINLGLLYHLRNVDDHLRCCFAMAPDMVLETVVCDSIDPHAIRYLKEDPAVDEEALRGTGSRPSPFYVERVAAENAFRFHRLFDADLNVGDQFVYDWQHHNDNRPEGWRLRRMWRFTSDTEASNSHSD